MKRWKGRRSKTSIKFDHLGSVGIHSIGVMKTAPRKLERCADHPSQRHEKGEAQSDHHNVQEKMTDPRLPFSGLEQ